MSEEGANTLPPDLRAAIEADGLNPERLFATMDAVSKFVVDYGSSNDVHPKEMVLSMSFVLERLLVAYDDAALIVDLGKKMLSVGLSKLMEEGDMSKLADAGIIAVGPEGCPGCPECEGGSIH